MKYLLDANVISETIKPNADFKVLSFLNYFNCENIYLSAFTIGELCYGIERMPEGKRKHDLTVWVYMKLPISFKNRIVSLDNDVFVEWGKLRAKAKETIP